MEENKIQPHMGRKQLNEKNKIFLEKLAEGHPVVDAYRLAGYTGSNHTAYEMRRQLKKELREVLEAKGYSMEGIAADILKLAQLPVDMTKHQNGIPLGQKIQILKLFAQTLKDSEPKAPPAQQNVTAFIINRAQGQAPKINIVDTQAEPNDKEQGNKE